MPEGVKVSSAYVEISADVDSVVDDVKKSLNEAGKEAAKAGKKMGKDLSSEMSGALKDLGKGALDSLKQEAENVGKSAAQSLTSSFSLVGKSIQSTTDQMSQLGDKVNSSLSSLQKMGNDTATAVNTLKSSAQGVLEQVSSIGTALDGLGVDQDVVNSLQGVSTAMGTISTAVANKDFVGGMRGFAGALHSIGEDETADTLNQVGDATERISSSAANIKGGLQGAKRGMDEFKNSGKGLDGLNKKLQATGGIISEITGTIMSVVDISNFFAEQSPWYKNNISDPLKRLYNGPGSNPVYGPVADPGYVPPSSSFPGGMFVPGLNDGLTPMPGTGLPGLEGGVTAPVPSTVPLLPGGAFIPGLTAAPSGMTSGGAMVRPAAMTGPSTQPSGAAKGSPIGGPPNENAIREWAKAKFGIPNSFGSGSWENASHNYDGGWHHPGGAKEGYGFDFHGTPAQMTAMANYIADNYAGQTLELIYQGQGFSPSRLIKNGKFGDVYGPGTLSQHTDHVHWATDVMPSYETGTDEPLPEDVVAQLHAGEVVVPKAQVDAVGGQQGVDDALASADRTAGYMPAAAAANAGGVPGTSSLAALYGLGNQAVSGLIDTGASAAQMGLGLGTMGAGSAAGGFGIQMAATQAKRLSSYAFQALSIGTDAAIEQLFPFGAPRWIGYDYTSFVPQVNATSIGVTTGEKAAQQSAQPDLFSPDIPKVLDQMPGGPVNAGALPGMQGLGASAQTAPAGAQAVPQAAPQAVVPDASPTQRMDSTPLDQSPWGIPWTSFGVYDDGGVLPHNGTALNMSGRPELVLNPQQTSAFMTKPPTNGSGGATYNLYISDLDEGMRKVKAKERLDAMRYTGRF